MAEKGNGVWCYQSEEFMTKTGTCRGVGVERIIPSRADSRKREREALLWPTSHRKIADYEENYKVSKANLRYPKLEVALERDRTVL